MVQVLKWCAITIFGVLLFAWVVGTMLIEGQRGSAASVRRASGTGGEPSGVELELYRDCRSLALAAARGERSLEFDATENRTLQIKRKVWLVEGAARKDGGLRRYSCVADTNVSPWDVRFVEWVR